MRHIGYFILLVVLAGCSPTVDSSSQETYKESVKKVRNALSPDLQDKFSETLTELSCYSRFVSYEEVERAIVDLRKFLLYFEPLFCSADPISSIDGMTGKEIIDQYWDNNLPKTSPYESLRSAAQNYREIAVWLKALMETRLTNSKVILDKISITMFESDQQSTTSDEDSIPQFLQKTREPNRKIRRLRILNGSTVALKWLTYSYESREAGRQIANDVGTGSVSFDGGIEPGETQEQEIGWAFKLERYDAASYRFEPTWAVDADDKTYPANDEIDEEKLPLNAGTLYDIVRSANLRLGSNVSITITRPNTILLQEAIENADEQILAVDRMIGSLPN